MYPGLSLDTYAPIKSPPTSKLVSITRPKKKKSTKHGGAAADRNGGGGN